MKSKYQAIPVIALCITILLLIFTITSRNQEITCLSESMTDYNFIISNQIETITVLEKKLARTQIVKVSFYHPPSRGINSDSDPTKTATMRKPVAWRTVAISDELFEDGWLGHKVYIDGFGVFIAEDRMNSSITGKQIDVCVKSRKRAITLGIKHNVIAVKL